MTGQAEYGAAGRGKLWRIGLWSLLAALLALPAAAMRLHAEGVDWSGSDFVVMGVLLGLVGLGAELVVRASSSLAWRAGAAVAILTVFLTIWVNLAVGMIGPEDNPYNLAFAAAPAIALLGAALARRRPEGLARAMAAAAAAQALASAAGLAADPRGAVFSMAFAVPWLIAAALFRKAAGERGGGRR